MMPDVLVVDDEEGWVGDLSRLVDPNRFKVEGFTDFDEALDYVVKKSGDIYACFVDMKPMRVVPRDPTDEERRLLATPEKIFKEAKSRAWVDRFYFISAHKSEYDNAVLERTGAKYIDKEILGKEIQMILSE